MPWRLSGVSGNSYRLVFSTRPTIQFQDNDEVRLKRTRIHCFGANSIAEVHPLPPLRNNYKHINVLHGGTDHGDEIEVKYSDHIDCAEDYETLDEEEGANEKSQEGKKEEGL